MLIALIENARSAPEPGLKGSCPRCGQPALAKCGPLKSWHWAHKVRQHCDPWWENETDWHRAWKQCFQLDWQEIQHFDETGEKHIADVKTPAGLAIEFQNSPITAAEMRSREHFYDTMVWVVNAASFRDNLSISHRPLPPPGDPILSDVMFEAGLASNQSCFGFFRPSTFIQGLSLQRLYRYEELEAEIKSGHRGHYALTWQRAKEVWLQATKPVYLDTGQELLELVQYSNHSRTMYGCKRVAVETFLASHGGRASALLKVVRT